jgi:hypothetical protein
LLVSAGLSAQEPERWYQIELIVFRYVEPIGVDGEEWPAAAQLPDISRAITLLEDLPEFGDELEAPDPEPKAGSDTNTDPRANTKPMPVAFHTLPESELRLTGAASRMARDNAVEVLQHLAWRQPSFAGSPGGAPRVYLRDEAARVAAPPEAELALPSNPGAGVVRALRFEGTVRLRIGRYVYFDSDLVFMHEQTPLRLLESRRMRLGELHYLDHPLFGVIVQVLPYRLEGQAGVEETALPEGGDSGEAVEPESETGAEPLDGPADD